MARTHVGEFSLTPSPQSYELHGECSRSSEFHLVLPLMCNPCVYSHITIAYLPLQAYSFFTLTRLHAFAISFLKLECREQDLSLIILETWQDSSEMYTIMKDVFIEKAQWIFFHRSSLLLFCFFIFEVVCLILYYWLHEKFQNSKLHPCMYIYKIHNVHI